MNKILNFVIHPQHCSIHFRVQTKFWPKKNGMTSGLQIQIILVFKSQISLIPENYIEVLSTCYILLFLFDVQFMILEAKPHQSHMKGPLKLVVLTVYLINASNLPFFHINILIPSNIFNYSASISKCMFE